MGAPSEENEVAARFARDARSAGLVLPTTRALNPWLATATCAILVVAALSVGYATNWINLSRGHPNPLSGLPGCPAGGYSVSVATEAGASATLPTAWPALVSGFSSATGGCLAVASTATTTGFAQLSSLGLDALVGPTLPAGTPSGSLGAETYDVPLMVAPIVVLVNTDGLGPSITLSASALAGIYLGTVTSWSNPLLTSTNPTLASKLNVSVVFDAGPSAATQVFSEYLSLWNATFRASVGSGPNVSWPVGEEASSPTEVAAWVGATPGAVGFAPGRICPTPPSEVVCASVQSGPSSYVTPTAGEVAAAAQLEANSSAAVAGNWTNVTGVAPVNSTAYPMVETTYAILFKDLGTAYGSLLGFDASKWLIAFLFWVASNASGVAGSVEPSYGYFPLPSAFATMAEETVLSVTYLGNYILLPPSGLEEGGGEGGGGETGEF